MKAKEKPETTDLEGLATRLDAMALEAEALSEDAVVKSIRTAAKSARWADKLRANRAKTVGNLVAGMQAKGLSAEEIVARLSGVGMKQ